MHDNELGLQSGSNLFEYILGVRNTFRRVLAKTASEKIFFQESEKDMLHATAITFIVSMQWRHSLKLLETRSQFLYSGRKISIKNEVDFS